MQSFNSLLEEWQQSAIVLANAKALEEELRRRVFAIGFPAPTEGTQHKELFGEFEGYKLTGTYRINRNLDETILPTVLAELRTRGVANTEKLVSWKPSLVKSQYDTLGGEYKAVIDQAITTSVGMPAIKLTPPKASKKP